MSREEPCAHGAVSDRSLCLALRVTSGTQRPLGSAGVGNYPPHMHTHQQALTHTLTRSKHRMPTLHCPHAWRMTGWVLDTKWGYTNTDVRCRRNCISSVWWTSILSLMALTIDRWGPISHQYKLWCTGVSFHLTKPNFDTFFTDLTCFVHSTIRTPSQNLNIHILLCSWDEAWDVKKTWFALEMW